MGGEKFATLMYGPKIKLDIMEWIDKFNLMINKKQLVKDFILNEQHDYEEPFDYEDKEFIDTIFSQEFDESAIFDDLLYDFLKSNSLTYIRNSNFNDDGYLIGKEVKDYDLFTEDDKQKVKDFCLKYNLTQPTFYAGIYGEFS